MLPALNLYDLLFTVHWGVGWLPASTVFPSGLLFCPGMLLLDDMAYHEATEVI